MNAAAPRVARLRKALALHLQMERLEAGRLAAFEQDVREARVEAERIVGSLQQDAVIALGLSSMILERLRRAESRRREAERAAAAQAQTARRQSRRVKQMERLIEKAEAVAEQQRALEALADVAEFYGAAQISAP